MWWIALIVGGLIIVAIIAMVVTNTNYDNGDYGDGGGKQVGGDNRSTFFMAANDKAGIRGEQTVNYHLRPLLRNDEYLLANLLVPLKNGNNIEIDAVLISRKGIFCVETKNWVGHISGNDESEYWIQRYDDYMPDKQHRNPIKQNQAHCEILERKLRNRFKINNVVIFVSNEDYYGDDTNYAFNIRGFKQYYRGLEDNYIDGRLLGAIYETLLPFVATQEQIEEHKNKMENKYH